VLPATYLLSITVGSTEKQTCEITLAEGAEIDFALVGEDITVVDPAHPPIEADDIFIGSSPLCG
jgi:hypothetical protein